MKRAPAGEAEAPERFWLSLIQTYHWGTFSGLHRFVIARKGHLFVGPSGAGKSTALDAHAALTTPPLWLNFNVAAREAERGGGVDRSALSYVRGAWAEQTADSGEVAAQYLRPGTTWSVIAETYRNGRGEVVSLAQLLWIRGTTSAPTELRKLHLVFKRELDLHEFERFARDDFDVRKLKAGFTEAWIGDRFSSYQERFRGLLGIGSEAALKLLHKTQSAKNLGDLNAFLRDFMLDVPQTYRIADDLVAEFGDLNAAHESVLQAEHQIATLLPARADGEALAAARATALRLAVLHDALEPWREQAQARLLTEVLADLVQRIDGGHGDLVEHKRRAATELVRLNDLRSRRAGLGGALITDLEQQRSEADAARAACVTRRERTEQACRALGWRLPESAAAMLEGVERAKAALQDEAAREQAAGEQLFAVRQAQQASEAEFRRLRDEIQAMERQPSNIAHAMLQLRQALADAVGATSEALPFAGELMQVKASEARWQGAAERVLRGLALSLVVDERWLDKVSRWVNDTDLGTRLVYLRALPRNVTGATPGADSLLRKIDVAPGPWAQWLQEELQARFDYACLDDLAALGRATRAAVTPQGLVRHNHQRHEKDDRSAVHDRRHWLLGFDNSAKLQLFRADAQRLAATLAELQQQRNRLDEDQARQRALMRHCQTLVTQTWPEIDVASAVRRVEQLAQRIQAERQARPQLDALDAEIAHQENVHEFAERRAHQLQAAIDQWSKERQGLEADRSALDARLLGLAIEASVHDDLVARFAGAGGATLTLKHLGEQALRVERALGSERSAVQARSAELGAAIERRLADFVRTWPAESDGLDARLASLDDFLGKLKRLQADRLPEFRERFMALLTQQSDQNLIRLEHQLETERNAIRERLELVNESLRGAEFNPGTFLTIESGDKLLEAVKDFRADLKAAHSGSLSSDPQLAERRFAALKALVQRLASQDAAGQRWRALVLDVRQHIDFIARERDAAGVEIEVYRSGAGKSGGQRQKLAATCLAAALRYQLAGEDGAYPRYTTVVLDEAFDKADPQFTALAMNIFVTFGFQMVVATPMRSVMALEPFIGGASYISISERKHSQARAIAYDDVRARLALDAGTPPERADAAA